MITTIRRATLADLSDLVALDTVAAMEASRKDSIACWLEHDVVLVAVVQERVVGYAVLNHAFFSQAQVEMLMVAAESRGQGIGQSLIRAAEAVTQPGKLFITTNQSNDRMQRLLIRSGYRVCGFIGELDPGDPELVFFKTLPEPGW